MAMYLEQRVEQLESDRAADRVLIDTIAAGLATLTVDVRKNHEQAQRNHREAMGRVDGLRDEMNQRFAETDKRIDGLRDEMNQRIDKTNLRIDALRDETRAGFDELRRDNSEIKSILIRILEKDTK
jgi:uncharacterized coiled-coil protein SlyX